MARRFGCLLCGFDIEDVPTSEPDNWKTRYRAVYRNGSDALVSGVALYDTYPVWRVPKDPMLRWDTVPTEDDLLQLPVMKTRAANGLHGFIIHDACWCLLQKVPGASLVSLQRMMAVCRSLPFPVTLNGLCWGHDYGGLLRPWLDDRYAWQEGFFYLREECAIVGAVANPFHGPEITGLLSNLEAKDADPGGPVQSSVNGDCFTRLPLELRSMILVLLPTNDALSLRLVSRTFQSLLSDLTFWRSRFLPGGERGFLFEAREPSIFNHLGALLELYRLTRKSIANPELLNRRRIWHLAQRLLPLIQPPLISNIGCQRTETVTSPGWHTLRSMVQREDLAPQRPIFGIPHYPTTTAEIQVPPGAVRVGIAVIDTGVWDYITGIRIMGQGQDGESQFAGYLFIRNEHFFDVTALHGFRVAMGRNGLRALQVIGPRHQASRWVGRSENVPISGRLMTSGQITSIRVTLDGYKITALSVHARQTDDGHTHFAETESLRHTAIWYPNPPPASLVLNEASFTNMYPLRTVYEPLCWVNFGGDRGCRLSSLQGFIYNEGSTPQGLRFLYDDAAEEMRDASLVQLGGISDNELPDAPRFTIDGTGGERICSLSVGFRRLPEDDASTGYRPDGFIQYLTITTNRGRSKTIGQFDRDLEMRDVPAAPGTTITGLYANRGDERVFVNLGVISEHL
ncbi:Cyclin-like F-box [Cordyceps militaris]|uniref:Cyclin-like F-box n=1 Tax=Cordyceps militaris TaxID=73501 RepID=A0A2H4SUH3_CORMI|nr:Cyclin-like F-box [Cordyceps militaris]